jgi:ribonuclease H-related protein
MKKKYYAYLVDKKSGITDNWPECQKIVSGVNGAKYKSFESEEAAEAWLNAGADYKLKNVAVEDGIYFDAGTGAGKGVEINVTDKLGKSYLKENLGHEVTNNFGELLACKNALEIAVEKNVKKVFGDSKLVIDFWSKWMIKKEVEEETKKLAKKVSVLRKKFEESGGEVVRISGGANPADLGFHR